VALPVVWIPEADADLKHAVAWYEKIDPDLGKRFSLAVQALIEAISGNPFRFQVQYKEIRRAGVRQFRMEYFFKWKATVSW